MRRLMVALAALAASCGSPERAQKVAPSAEERYAADSAAVMSGASAEPEATPSPAAAPPVVRAMLAYDYAVAIETPAAKLKPLLVSHEAACRAAGPEKCEVLQSSVRASGDDYVNGQLAIRGEPRWLEGFRGGLQSQAKAAGGRVTSESVTSEDLTRAVVDTEARINAQKTLRARLQQILRERPGKLGELLETERELARVQGEIDSAESQLAVMRARIDMSRLDLSYQSKSVAVAGGTFEPVTRALTEFFSVVAVGLATIISAIAFALPFAIVLGPLVWWVLRRRAKARARNSE